MKIKYLQMRKAIKAFLFILLLTAVGMKKAASQT